MLALGPSILLRCISTRYAMVNPMVNQKNLNTGNCELGSTITLKHFNGTRN